MTTPPPEEYGAGHRPPRIRPFLPAPPIAGEPPLEQRSPEQWPAGEQRPAEQWPGEQWPAEQWPPEPQQPEPPAAVPRPFVLTAGRVTGHPDIDLHTQVTARVDDLAAAQGLPREQAAIVALCVVPMSVAEISARLRLHLGVTKILVGDLWSAGYLDVHLADVFGPHDPATILRVIDGLRAFS